MSKFTNVEQVLVLRCVDCVAKGIAPGWVVKVFVRTDNRAVFHDYFTSIEEATEWINENVENPTE